MKNQKGLERHQRINIPSKNLRKESCKKIAFPKHSINMFSQHPLVYTWGKWVTEIKCFDQDQRRGVRGLKPAWDNKSRQIMLREWAEHREPSLMLLGPARSGCKPPCPQLPIQKPECCWSRSEALMAETWWELGVNNYLPRPREELLQLVVQVLGSLAKTQMVWTPLPIPNSPKCKVLGGSGEQHGSGALPALPSTCAWLEYRSSPLYTPPGMCVIVFHILGNTSAEYHRKYQHHLSQSFSAVWLRGHSALALHVCGEE